MIRFLVPEECWPQDIAKVDPIYNWSINRYGKWNWTLQTYQRLKDHGYACQVALDLRASGIVIGHRDVIPTFYRPHSEQLLVCIAAERGLHPFAQFNILQNPVQETLVKHESLERLWNRLIGRNCGFIRYWPQPNLVPRNPDRGDRFENVVFMGVMESLAPELRGPDFESAVMKLGMKWLPIHDKSKWPDYSEVDAVVALRANADPVNDRKPATKLYNAWLAGVPAILGAESAFQAEGAAGADYLEATSVREVLDALRRLRDDAALRRKIVEAGNNRAESLSYSALCQQWMVMFQEHLVPLFERWKSFPSWRRNLFFSLQRANLRRAFLLRKAKEILGTTGVSNR